MALIRGGIQVKSHVQLFADNLEDEVSALSFGTYHGHSPPEGPTQAIDIFNPDTSIGHILQDRICQHAIANARAYGVRYVIRREHIWNIERAAEGWRRQTHKGNRRLDHYDHVHITFYSSAPGPFDRIHLPRPSSPIPRLRYKESHLFLYSTAKNVDQGSIWLVINGRAYRMHRTDDVQRIIDKGIPNLGEMSEAFHNLFPHEG